MPSFYSVDGGCKIFKFSVCLSVLPLIVYVICMANVSITADNVVTKNEW